MKKTNLVILSVLSLIALCIWFSCNPFEVKDSTNPANISVLDAADTVKATTGPEGYASLNGGTTGGAGGASVTVSNGTDLINQIKAGGPKIIYVTGTITLANSSEKVIYVKRVSNISIIGQGADFNGIGFKCVDSSNIIIQNVKVHHTKDSENGDGVEIDGCTNVWVDHCEFYNESPAVQSDKDMYDGLVDTKNASKYVTVSWNYFHDHWKGCLAGHSDSASGDTAMTVTYYANYFKNINTRIPLLRYGSVHFVNNYVLGPTSSASNIRQGAKIKVENTVYENVGSGTIDEDTGIAEGPIGTWYSDTTGYWNVVGVQYINCLGNQPTTSTTTFNPPYSMTIMATSSVKSTVTAGAGLLK